MTSRYPYSGYISDPSFWQCGYQSPPQYPRLLTPPHTQFLTTRPLAHVSISDPFRIDTNLSNFEPWEISTPPPTPPPTSDFVSRKGSRSNSSSMVRLGSNLDFRIKIETNSERESGLEEASDLGSDSGSERKSNSNLNLDLDSGPTPTSLYGPILKDSRDIRLLILHPSSDPQSPILCSLVRTSLGSAPRFEALSYMWGKPDNDEKSTIINGIKKPIRRNLWDALQHFRSWGSGKRVLWIDAICIDQSNISERNHQVQQMSRIYQRAAKVLIWLGIRSCDSARALDFINYIGNARFKNPYFKLNSKDYLQEMRAVRNLLQRPYWDRLWIIQEVLVAKEAKLICGVHEVDWEHFSRFQVAFEKGDIGRPTHDTSGIYETIPKTIAFSLDRQRILCQNNDSTLQDLMQDFASSLCSEIRDKVYGLVGLANDAQDLVIDYTSPVFNLFEDVVILRKFKDCSDMIQFSHILQYILQGCVDSSIPAHTFTGNFVGALGHYAGRISKFGPLMQDIHSYENNPEAFTPLLQSTSLPRTVLKYFFAKDRRRSVLRAVIPILSTKSYGLPSAETFPEYLDRLSRYRNHNIWGEKAPLSLEPWGQLSRLNTLAHLEYLKYDGRFGLEYKMPYRDSSLIALATLGLPQAMLGNQMFYVGLKVAIYSPFYDGLVTGTASLDVPCFFQIMSLRYLCSKDAWIIFNLACLPCPSLIGLSVYIWIRIRCTYSVDNGEVSYGLSVKNLSAGPGNSLMHLIQTADYKSRFLKWIMMP